MISPKTFFHDFGSVIGALCMVGGALLLHRAYPSVPLSHGILCGASVIGQLIFLIVIVPETNRLKKELASSKIHHTTSALRLWFGVMVLGVMTLNYQYISRTDHTNFLVIEIGLIIVLAGSAAWTRHVIHSLKKYASTTETCFHAYVSIYVAYVTFITLEIGAVYAYYKPILPHPFM